MNKDTTPHDFKNCINNLDNQFDNMDSAIPSIEESTKDIKAVLQETQVDIKELITDASETYEISKKIPQCSDKSLFEIWHCLKIIKVLEYKSKENEKYFKEIPLELNLSKCIDNFIMQLKNEKLFSPEIERLILNMNQCLKDENSEKTVLCFNNIFKYLTPFNIFLFNKLLATTLKNSSTLEGKTTLIVLGETGAGKSSLIQFILGVPQKLSKDKNNASYLQSESTQETEKIVKLFKTSSRAISQTSTLTAHELNLKGLELGTKGVGDYVICDTAGFLDTRTSEHDLSNTICNALLMSKSKELVLIFVIDCNCFGPQRSQIFKKLIHRIANAYPEHEDYLEQGRFTFLFTKNFLDLNILGTLKNLRSDSEKDEIFKLFVSYMIESIEDKAEVKYSPNPAKSDHKRKDLLKYLLAKDKRITPDPEGKTFNFCIAEETKFSLKEQLKLYHQKMLNAFQRHEYEYICFFLQILNNFQLEAKLPEIAKTNCQIKDDLNILITRYYTDLATKLNERINPLNGNFTKNDIYDYIEGISKLKVYKEYKINDILGKNSIDENFLLNNLSERLNEICNFEICQISVDFAMTILDRLILLENLELSSLKEIDFAQKLKNYLVNINQAISGLEDEFKANFKINNYKTCVDLLTTIEAYKQSFLMRKESLKKFESINNMTNSENRLKILFYDLINDRINIISDLVNKKRNITNDYVKKIEACLEELFIVEKAFIAFKNLNVSEISKEKVKELCGFVDEIGDEIKKHFELTKEFAYSSYVDLECIRNIKIIEEKTFETYLKVKDIHYQFVKGIQNEVFDYFTSVFTNGNYNESENLSEYLVRLEKSSKVPGFNSTFQKELLVKMHDKTVNEIKKLVEEKENKLSKTSLELESNKTNKYYQIYEIVFKLDPIGDIIPKAKELLVKYKEWYQNNCQYIFKQLFEQLEKKRKSEDYDIKSILKDYDFLKLLENNFMKIKEMECFYLTLNFYSESIFDYIETNNKKAIINFEYLEKFNDSATEMNKDNVLKGIKQLNKFLKQVYKYEIFQVRIQNPDVEEWKKKFLDFHEELQIKINDEEKGSLYDILELKRDIVKQLKDIESHFLIETSISFSSIYKQICDAMGLSKLLTQIIELEKYLQNKEFKKMGDLLKDYSSSQSNVKTVYVKMKQCVADFCKDITKNTIKHPDKISDFFDENSLEETEKNISLIEDLKENLLDNKNNNDIIEKLDGTIEKVVRKNHKALLSKIILAENYYLKDLKLELGDNMFNKVKYVLNTFEERFNSLKIGINIHDLEKKRIECENKLKEKFEKLDLNKYEFNKIESYISKDKEEYNLLRCDLEEIIHRNICNKIDEISGNKNNNFKENDIANLKKLSDLITSNQSKEIIQTFFNDYVVIEKEGIEKIKQVFIKNDWNELKKISEIYESNYCLQRIISEGLNKKIKEMSDLIKKMDIKKTDLFVEKYKELKEVTDKFEIKNRMDFIKNKLEESFNHQDAMNFLFFDIELFPDFSEFKELYEPIMDVAKILFELKDLIITPEYFNDEINSLHQGIKEKVVKNFNSYKIAIEEGNGAEIKKFIQTLPFWNNFYECAIKYKKESNHFFQYLSSKSIGDFLDLDSSFENLDKLNKSRNISSSVAIENKNPFKYSLSFIKEKYSISLIHAEIRLKVENYNNILNDNCGNFENSIKDKKEKVDLDIYYKDINDKNVKCNDLILNIGEDIIGKQNIITYTGIQEKIQKWVSSVVSKSKKYLKDIVENYIENNQFDFYFKNISSMMQCMDTKTKEKLEKEEIEIKKTIEIKTDELVKSIAVSSKIGKVQIEKVCDSLIKMQKIISNICFFNKDGQNKMDFALNEYKKLNGEKNLILVKVELQKEENGNGTRILDTAKCFQGHKNKIFDEKTKVQNLEYVMKNIEGDNLNEEEKNLIKKATERFFIIYDQLVSNNLTEENSEKIISNMKSLILNNLGNNSKNKSWNQNIANNLPEILSHIFAIWTLQNKEAFLTEKDADVSLLKKPHCSQIVAIFRTLGIGNKNFLSKLPLSLVQIQTGEGKSVILGMLSILFALLGFDVSCACFSSLLSKRDYEEFMNIFALLNIENHIHYGTFQELSERLINTEVNIRLSVKNLIKTGTCTYNKMDKKNKKMILLFDEADVFFNRDFYGNLYIPSCKIQDEVIVNLFNYLWDLNASKSPLTLETIKKSPQYKECLDKFKWGENGKLLEELLKGMILDLRNFDSHQDDYKVLHEKIAYKLGDSYSSNIIYGHKTAFAYIKEYKLGNVTKKSMEDNVGLSIYSGHFSYAEIPKSFFITSGVSGTLKTLCESHKKVIKEDYNIENWTIVPSVFAKSNYETKKIVLVCKNEFTLSIHQSIKDNLNYYDKKNVRAILVFFRDSKIMKEELKKFKDSQNYLVMSEESTSNEKNYCIKKSTISGAVLFTVSDFARGTDFTCYDQLVENNGGIHVIGAYFPEELAEEEQLMGRTGRQGQNGSFNYVLLDIDLAAIIGETVEEITKQYKNLSNTDFYNYINERRNNNFEIKYRNLKTRIEHSKIKHEESISILEKIKENDNESFMKYLIQENSISYNEQKTSKTLLAFDVTGSMSPFIEKVKTMIYAVFERAQDIIKKKEVIVSFQLQLIGYRNYSNDLTSIMEMSNMESDPKNLYNHYLKNIKASGGYGSREAVEIAFFTANEIIKKDDISQIILIGDAEPNTPEEVLEKRNYLKETYWQSTKFKNCRHYLKELADIIAKNIPCNTFYVHHSAKVGFEKIAADTGGKSEFLDVNNKEKGEQILTDVITTEILRDVGKLSGLGNQLVDEYRKIHSYI